MSVRNVRIRENASAKATGANPVEGVEKYWPGGGA